VPSASPTIYELIRRIVRAEMATVGTLLPGRIVRYDGATKRADVVSLLRFPAYDEDNKRVFLDPPTIPDIPVVCPASEASGQQIKVSAGDTVLIFISQLPIDELLDRASSQGPFDPVFPRSHALQDCFALPVVWEGTATPAQQAADRYIGGDDVRIGDAATAQSLAYRQDVQAKLAEMLPAIVTYVDSMVLGGPPTPPVAPSIAGTQHLRGS
jgi:hypothetical protein